MYEIKFRFYPNTNGQEVQFCSFCCDMELSTEVLEIMDPKTGDIDTIHCPRRIDRFLKWNLTDIYIHEWTTAEDNLGLYS